MFFLLGSGKKNIFGRSILNLTLACRLGAEMYSSLKCLPSVSYLKSIYSFWPQICGSLTILIEFINAFSGGTFRALDLLSLRWSSFQKSLAHSYFKNRWIPFLMLTHIFSVCCSIIAYIFCHFRGQNLIHFVEKMKEGPKLCVCGMSNMSGKANFILYSAEK